MGNGSLQDPQGDVKRYGTSRKVDGLAHFLEHMLFMGTEKYPEEDLYERLLAEHGGTDNACTEDDCTYYYFEVENEMLEQIIDVYS